LSSARSARIETTERPHCAAYATTGNALLIAAHDAGIFTKTDHTYDID
jgi:hypothetical protein